MPFARSDAAGARAYVDSVFSSGGFVPGRKHPSQWTDAYTVRLANAWQRQTAAGRPLTRQAARGHTPRVLPGGRIVSTEHPRQFVMRGGEAVSVRGVQPTRLGVIIQREYRDPAAMLRWIANRLPTGTSIQVLAHGELRPEYAAAGVDEVDDEVADVADVMGGGVVAWRTVYTGDTFGTVDENGVRLRDLDDLRDAVDRVFIQGSVDRYILRWQ